MMPEVPEGAVWAIPLLPLGSLVAIALVRPQPRWSGYVTVGSIQRKHHQEQRRLC